MIELDQVTLMEDYIRRHPEFNPNHLRGLIPQPTEQGERDPNGKQAHEAGSKLDAGKSPVRQGLLEYFPRACLAVADISAVGAQKYTWRGWETVENGVNRYGDAELRHVCKAAIEGELDLDTGKLHAAHEAWNAMARLELILKEKG